METTDKKNCYDQLKTLCEEYSEEIVDFEEYAKQKTGIPFVEYMDEKCIFSMKIR